MIGLGGDRKLRCRLVVLWIDSLCDVLDGTVGLIDNEISHLTTLFQCTSKRLRL